MDGGNGVAARGALAGLVAATGMILWFLLIDLAQGRPLQTPAFLSGLLFGVAPAEVGPGRILLFTALHFLVFTLLGIGVALLVSRIRIGLPFLAGIVLGFLLFDVMFYASVAVTGINVTRQLGWPAVLGGSVLAGILLMATLRFTGVAPGITIVGLLNRHPIIRDGIIAGLIGAVVVAVWFLVVDIAFRRAFLTPAAFGSAFFYGATSPAAIEISVATVLGFTFIHFFIFIVGGLVAAAFFVAAERQPPLILGFILVLATALAFVFGAIAFFASWLLDTIGWWALTIGTIIGTAAIVGYLAREHPEVVRRLRRHTIEEPQ